MWKSFLHYSLKSVPQKISLKSWGHDESYWYYVQLFHNWYKLTPLKIKIITWIFFLSQSQIINIFTVKSSIKMFQLNFSYQVFGRFIV